jgi:hypothetical protein
VANRVGALGCLTPLFGSTTHADGWARMTAMQIRLMHDAVLNDVARAFDFQRAIHGPLDQQLFKDIIFTGYAQILLHL